MVGLSPVQEISEKIGWIEATEELIGKNMAIDDLEAIKAYMEEMKEDVEDLHRQGVISVEEYRVMRSSLSDAIAFINVNVGSVNNPWNLFETAKSDYKRFLNRWETLMESVKLEVGQHR